MTAITIEDATLRDMTFIAANMRDADRREIGAVFPGAPHEVATALFMASPGLCWVARIGLDPVAAYGIAALMPGVGSGWAYGTKRMRRAVPAMTEYGRRRIAPLLIAEGFRRVEVRTAIDHDLSHRWLESLGFVREGIAVDYGDGLDFVTYAARKRDWHVLFVTKDP